MRIVAGIYKSRSLLTPEGQGTRPTADVVREALFSILGNRVADTRVWDVFAGSGALGLEALSRGAAEVLFTDSSARALKVVRHNLDNLGETKGQTLLWRAPQGLGRLGLTGPFGLIFLDPPYESPLAPLVLAAAAKEQLVDSQTVALWEHDRKLDPTPQLPEAWDLLETRHWGRRAVSFLGLALGR